MQDLDVPALGLATIAALIAAAEMVSPFQPLLHVWWFALAVALCGAALLWYAAAALLGRRAGPAALAALGGAVLAACVASAAFVQGQPQRVPAAPGQVYRPPHGGSTRLAFPDVPAATLAGTQPWPGRVTVSDAFGTRDAAAGEVVRSGEFVFKVDTGPVAHVDASDPKGRPVTITQPDGAAFLSQYLTFTGLDGDKPEDYFALPALHRTVQVDFWPGLPSRGIDVPFVVLRIAEENGGALYEGVAVSGRPLRKAGVGLTFVLGTYPVVTASSAPPLVPFWAATAMVAAGLVGSIAKGALAGARASGKKGGVDRGSRAME